MSAKDKATNKEQKVSITGGTGLSEEEVEKAKADAEAHAEEDKKRKAGVEARNQLDGLVFQCEKQLGELGDKLPADKKGPIEAALADGKKVLENQEASSDELKAAHDKLQEAFAAAAQDMYANMSPEEQAAAQQAAAEAAGPESTAVNPTAAGKDDDDVVDADFEVVDDKK